MLQVQESNINILYIEDDLTVQESVSNILKMVVENIFLASNGEEALNILEDKSYDIDIIITDIKMPKLNGLELVEIVRRKEHYIPVIITTAFNETDYLHHAIELKVDKFILKPVKLKDLITEVEKLISVINTKRELERKRTQLLNYKKVINLTNYVLELDLDGNIIYISENLKQLFRKNLKLEEELKKLFQIDDYSTNKDNKLFNKVSNWDIFSKNISFDIDNKTYTFNLTAFASYEDNDKVEVVSIILKDFSEIVRKKDEHIESLYKDLVTTLPNRYALFKSLNEDDSNKVLILLDIDNYIKIRHTYGFKVSDAVLVKMANELRDYSNNKKIITEIYKLENSIFALSCKKEEGFNSKKLELLINDILDYFDKYVITVENLSIDISITLGTSCLGSSDLLLESYIALDSAYLYKKEFLCYTDLDNPKSKYVQNMNMQRKVKKALSQDLIVPYFQPIVNKEKKVVKYEALARVIDPEEDNKVLTPYFFLDVVKDSKIYEKFTVNIIEKAIKSSLKLKKPVGINLSFEDITNPVIINYLEDTLKKEHPYPIVLELLESEGLQDIDKTIHFCNIMKSYGALIAIDDFGAGYSNYDYFFNIPFDILKLDSSLVKRVEEYTGYLLLESIVSFAKKLDIKIVAEFVENEKIFEELKSLDIDFYQGYYFDKPKPLEIIIEKDK